MAKIAIIGAGSIIFSTTLLNDMLQTPGLEGSTYALMGPTLPKLQQVEEHTNKIIQKQGLTATVYSTTDRRDAVKDADYVVTTFQVGGMEAYKSDYMIPLKYGVDQSSANAWARAASSERSAASQCLPISCATWRSFVRVRC